MERIAQEKVLERWIGRRALKRRWIGNTINWKDCGKVLERRWLKRRWVEKDLELEKAVERW